ncbi:MotA/TolQ/ExbB proton channel family protein [Bradyrhizobium japonicum]|jgi:biopolymer transport protein ExbB|nr:MotA/TolQ/ExbB proton channel family protein [Bradyrhizobium japonicum]
MLAFVFLAALWPSPAAAWWNDQWTLRKKITIDTGPSGAGISDAIGTTPILVRLHVGNFRFGGAKEDGGDLRFVAGDDKTPLKHHVEKYDSLLGEALVWVGVPDLKPGTKNDIWLYYGNQKAPTAVDAKGTYDPDTLLVYHFNDRSTPAQDITAWANTAQNAVPAADGAIIGQGARLDGQTALTLPGSPSLVTAEGGELSWSLWIKMTAVQPGAVLFSRSEGANGLTVGLDNGVAFVEVTSGGNTQRAAGGAAIAAGTWHQVAFTAKGAQIILYVDGSQVATLAAALPTMTGVSQLGRAAAAAAPAADAAAPAADAAQATAPAAAPSGSAAGFAGDVDELAIAKVARSAGFIKLSAVGQGPDQAKLISFSVDEENAGWFSGGYFGVILRSVTLDGWVVIGLLGIMALISWYVMVDRISYLNRVSAGNTIFLKHFRETSTDIGGLLQLDSQENDPGFGGELGKKQRKVVHAAPLYRLFAAGAQEIRRRFAGGGYRRLSPQAIQSIRAVLDSGFVRESQRLNRLMVMLTIAISGGPFLGLLGTVVGVMITFAAIAASGDVNVNAIAPGIAAALVATVAGLGVAIPSLFAYNYLTIRIKDVSSEMQVFVDEFITRIAESYELPEEPVKQAAE